jgi:hypothetical protein
MKFLSLPSVILFALRFLLDILFTDLRILCTARLRNESLAGASVYRGEFMYGG